MRRPFRRRYRRRLNKRGVFTLLLMMSALVFAAAEWRLHCVFEDVTYNKAQQMIARAVNEAVETVSEQESGELFTAAYGEDGSVQSLTVNAAAMNRVKSSVALAVQDALSDNHCETGVPLGTLLGSALLHGKGPNLPLRVSADGNVEVDYESSFSSAGINQTCHRIILHVKVQAFTYVPGASGRVEQETSVMLSETVIVGDTPQLVPGWGSGLSG